METTWFSNHFLFFVHMFIAFKINGMQSFLVSSLQICINPFTSIYA